MSAPRNGEGPPLIDTSRPNMARVQDFLLGGKDNFAADREAAGAMTDPVRGHPGLRALARENRAFVLKAVRWAAAVRGIGQFADLGCGLPSRPPVHEEARAAEPGARVAYLDNDPIVVSHVRALEAAGEGLAAAEADAADPGAVLAVLAGLADEGGRKVIDLARPACVILGGTLSSMDAGTARGAVAGYAGALAPGSAVVISCLSYAGEDLAARMTPLIAAAGDWHNHSLADVGSFFEAGGLRVVRGQVADVHAWPLLSAENGARARVLGGVGLLG